MPLPNASDGRQLRGPVKVIPPLVQVLHSCWKLGHTARWVTTCAAVGGPPGSHLVSSPPASPDSHQPPCRHLSPHTPRRHWQHPPPAEARPGAVAAVGMCDKGTERHPLPTYLATAWLNRGMCDSRSTTPDTLARSHPMAAQRPVAAHMHAPQTAPLFSQQQDTSMARRCMMEVHLPLVGLPPAASRCAAPPTGCTTRCSQPHHHLVSGAAATCSGSW